MRKIYNQEIEEEKLRILKRKKKIEKNKKNKKNLAKRLKHIEFIENFHEAKQKFILVYLSTHEEITVLQVDDDQVCGTVWQGGLPTCHKFNATEFIVCVDPRINLNDKVTQVTRHEKDKNSISIEIYYLLMDNRIILNNYVQFVETKRIDVRVLDRSWFVKRPQGLQR